MYKVDILLDDAWVAELGPYATLSYCRQVRSKLKAKTSALAAIGLPVPNHLLAGSIKIRISSMGQDPATGHWETKWTQFEGDL
jgi:hypothetical protein